MTIRRADQFTSRAYRGVRYNRGVSLYVNDGTYAVPEAGEGLDLEGWELIFLTARPEGLDGVEYAIRGSVAYEFTEPARIRLDIVASELEKAVVATPTGDELRPIRVTVHALNASGQPRVLLNGVISFLPGGYTA